MGISKSHRLGLAVWLSAGIVTAEAIVEPNRLSAAVTSLNNNACMECHGDKTLTTTNAAGKEISLFVDLGKLALSVHKTNTCASCHTDLTSKHPDDNVR